MDASSRQGRGEHKSVEGGRIDLRNCALLALLILTWAVSWPVIKIGVREMPPLWFGVLRYAIATLCVFLVTSTAHRFFTTPPKADWPLILVSASLQMAAYSALTAVALVALPPGRASVLAFSTTDLGRASGRLVAQRTHLGTRCPRGDRGTRWRLCHRLPITGTRPLPPLACVPSLDVRVGGMGDLDRFREAPSLYSKRASASALADARRRRATTPFGAVESQH